MLSEPIGQPVRGSRSPVDPAFYKDGFEGPHGPRTAHLQAVPETQQEHLLRLQNDMKRQAQSQAARIKNRDVRRKFLTEAYDKITAATPGLRQQLRLRYLDHHRATMEKRDKAVLQYLSTLAPEVRDLKKYVHVNNIKDDGRNNLETEVKIQARVEAFLSQVDENDIANRIYSASVLGSQIDAVTKLPQINDATGETLEVTEYRRIIADIEVENKYKNLDEEVKIKLLASVKQDMDQARRRFDSMMNRQGTAEERDRKKKQLHNFEYFDAVITQFQDAAARGKIAKDDKGRPLKLPTISDFAGPQFSAAQRRLLEKRLRGEDRIYNRDAYLDYLGQARDAVTDADLTAIHEAAIRDRLDGRIGAKALGLIRTKIDAYKTKTPAAMEQKRYASILKTALGAHEQAIIAGYGTERIDKQHQAEALALYETLVSVQNVRPEEAYIETISRFNYEGNKLAGALLRAMPREVKHGVILRPDGSVDTRAMTKNQAGSSIELLQHYVIEQLTGLQAPVDAESVSEDEVYSLSKEELGAAQRRPIKARPGTGPSEQLSLPKRLTKSNRMKIRALYAMQKRIDVLSEILLRVKEGDWKDPAATDDKGVSNPGAAPQTPKNMKTN